MSEKRDWEKLWSELPADKQDQAAWDSRVEKFCPMTRKPCQEKVDPAGPEEPENYRTCQFWDEEGEGCHLRDFMKNLTDGPIVDTLGVFLYKQIFGQLPSRSHWVNKDGKNRTGPWEWEV